MIPFNLECALRGEPVMTRLGKKVKVAGYNENAKESEQLVGWIEGESTVSYWYFDGTRNPRGIIDDMDLFMRPIMYYTGVYTYYLDNTDPNSLTVATCGIYDNEEKAEKALVRDVEYAGRHHVIHGSQVIYLSNHVFSGSRKLFGRSSK